MRKPYPAFKSVEEKAVGLVFNIENNRLFRRVFRALSVPRTAVG
jgi:hypothetical protein